MRFFFALQEQGRNDASFNWGMKAYGRGYLRARTEISADKGGDICGQGRRYLRTKAEISTRKAAQWSDQFLCIWWS